MGYAQKGEFLKAKGVHHRLQVAHQCINGQVLHDPLRETAPPLIITD